MMRAGRDYRTKEMNLPNQASGASDIRPDRAKVLLKIKALGARRIQVVAERGKRGGQVAPASEADETAAREHAGVLVNEWDDLKSFPKAPGPTGDKALHRELLGIDIALDMLIHQERAAQSEEGIAYAEAISDRWQAVCRAVTLKAVELAALELRAASMLEACPDLAAMSGLPMINIVGSRPVREIPLDELVEIAVAQGVITRDELRAAQDVEDFDRAAARKKD